MEIREEVKDFLKSAPFSVLAAVLDLGKGPETVLLVKSTADLLESLRGADAPVRVGFAAERTDAGPVACLYLCVRAEGVGELVGEAYFDLLVEEDHESLARLGGQERLKVAFLGEDLSPVWLADATWDELDRVCAEQACDRAEQLWEDAGEFDPARAREAFQDRFPLEDLVRRIEDGRS
jgi:hypothetical protein